MHDPEKAWQQLRRGNERFVAAGHFSPDGSADGRQVAAVFRCADADVASEVVFGQSWGSLLDVSTWGHVVDTGVLATLEYAIGALDVPLVVILGHHGCAAMRATLRAWNDAVLPDGAARSVVEQAMFSIVRRGSAGDSVEAVSSAHVVETGLAMLGRSPVIARRVDAGTCGIVCAITDSAGRVRPYATIGAVGDVEGALLERV
ncbi:MAG: carbonic anhydrase [Actinomycetota bacterium]|nr:carbonic anhydrase [Actinomycetota bacterium]